MWVVKSALRKIKQTQMGLERHGWCFPESGQGSHPKGSLRVDPDKSGDSRVEWYPV